MATPDRNFTAEARAIDAMVWIDGVEVPFNKVEIGFQLDQPSRVAISIEPDEILELWRPKSKVHVWIRDPFPDKSRVPHDNLALAGGASDQRDEEYDKNTYMLFWEGEVVSINDTESADTRQTVITAHDLWNIPVNTNINLVEIGAGLKVAFINGSTFFGDIFSEGGAGDTQNLILGGMINYLFKQGDEAFTNDGPSKVDSGVVEIGKQLLLYLAQFNASYGLQAWRTNMFEKFTGIPDRSMQNFIRFSVLPSLMGQVQQTQTTSDVFSYFMQIISKFFHHTVTVPFPPLKNSKIDSWGELAIIPNLYYGFAPMCNMLFPENYTQRSVGRDFMSEPTRLGMSSISSSIAGFRTVHLAPEGLISYLSKQSDPPGLKGGADPVTLGRLHGARETSIPATKQSDIEFEKRGFFLDPSVADADKINLLKFLTPEELEKGILYVESQNAYQEFLGLSRLNASFGDADAVKNSLRKSAREQDGYITFMRLLAQYELNFRQVSRHTQITGIFNPWPVIGLPALICREGRSYKGLLVGLSHAISYGGGATTSYELAYTQLFRPKSLLDLGGDQLLLAKESLEAAFELQQGEYRTLVEDLQSRGLITEEEKRELLESGVGDLQAVLNELRDKAEAAKESFDPAAAETRYLSRRNAVFEDISGVDYGTTWFDLFDIYAGYSVGLLNANIGTLQTTVTGGRVEPAPDPYVVGLRDGEAEHPDERFVIQDFVKSGQVVKPVAWTELDRVNSSDIARFWSLVIRRFRLIYEEMLALTQELISKGPATISRGKGLLDAIPAATVDVANSRRKDRYKLQKLIDASKAEEAKVKREAKASIDKDQTRIDEIDAELATLVTLIATLTQELIDAGTPLGGAASLLDGRSWRISAAKLETTRLESKKVALQASIDATTVKLAVDVEILEIAREDLEKQRNAFREPTPWEWVETVDQALRFFSVNDPAAAAVGTKVFFNFENQRFNPTEGALTWDDVFTFVLNKGGAGGVAGINRVKRLVDDFFAAYARFYGAPPNPDAKAIASQLTRDFKQATKFVFQGRLDRFLDLSLESMEKINKNYSKFKEFLSELEMELPPIMPFSNDAMTRLVSTDKAPGFDEAVKGMVEPREEEGTFKFWAEGLPDVFSFESLRTEQVFKSLRQEVALRYDAYIRMLRKIFPFNEEDNDSEYRRQVDKGTQMSWANKLQARKGVTMAEFLERTGLKLESRSASDPDTFGKGTYYIAVAEGDVAETDFNSYFSKLGRLNIEGSGDISQFPLLESISEIREKARQGAASGSAPEWQFIRASVRQKVIEDYTKKHAVARAFRGRR